MTRQRGQSVVEFAFILPVFTLFLFGLIYGGIMFLQYFNLSNDARAEARRIAVMTTEQRDSYFGGSAENYPRTAATSKEVLNPKRFGTFYNVKEKIWVEYALNSDGAEAPNDVVVRVEFNRDNEDLPNVLKSFNWPPKEFAMEYRMQIEIDNE